MRNSGGFTLLELSLVLGLLGLGLAVCLPAARLQLDRAAVLGAREAVVARVARTRREARLAGGASLQLRREGSRLWIDAAGAAPDTLSLERRYGVRLDPGSASTSLSFDALGIGRVASRTLVLTRGSARASLTVSAHGRVRRQ